jgi:hypothetical protein
MSAIDIGLILLPGEVGNQPTTASEPGRTIRTEMETLTGFVLLLPQHLKFSMITCRGMCEIWPPTGLGRYSDLKSHTNNRNSKIRRSCIDVSGESRRDNLIRGGRKGPWARRSQRPGQRGTVALPRGDWSWRRCCMRRHAQARMGPMGTCYPGDLRDIVYDHMLGDLQVCAKVNGNMHEIIPGFYH